MSKVFSGHQPNFLPYMGVIYKIFQSDVFVIDDDVQYSRTSLHNANYLKVSGIKHKVTIPVSYRYGDLINQVKINYEQNWIDKLLRTLKMSYGKAFHFEEVYDMVEKHIKKKYKYLVELNLALLQEIVENFGFGCQIVIASRDVPTNLKKNERNVYQCLALGGEVYYSGTGGRNYNDEEYFARNGIEVIYSDYEPVKYKQLGRGFIEDLSVLDYIFNQGYLIPEWWERNR